MLNMGEISCLMIETLAKMDSSEDWISIGIFKHYGIAYMHIIHISPFVTYNSATLAEK